MAVTPMLTSDALAVKKWELQTYLEMVQRRTVGHMMSRGTIHFAPDFIGDSRAFRGDALTFQFAGRSSMVPVGEGGVLTNNLEALSLKGNQLVMNESRFGFESPNNGSIEQQRTTVDFDETSIAQLARRAAALYDTSALYQLAGSNPTSVTVEGTTYSTAAAKSHIQGHNAIVAPTDERIVRAGGRSSDETLVATDVMRLDLVDYAVELAETSTQAIERLDGDTFDLYMHTYQMTDLKQDVSGNVQWYTNELSYAQAGDQDNYLKRGVFEGMLAAGVYNNVNLYANSRVAIGENSSNSAGITTVRRAVLCGRNALAYASPYGGRLSDKDVPVKFRFQYRDFDKYKGTACCLLYGMKKMTFTGEQDYGSLVIGTYAASHA